MTTKNIETAVKEIKELTRFCEEIEAEITSLQDLLKAEMSARGTDEIVTNEYKIRYKDVTTSRFDSTAFKEKHSELYNQFAKAYTYKRFTIA